MRRAANRIRIRVLLGLLGTAVLPSDSWCQEPHASATFQAFRFSEVPWTMSIDSDGVSAVKPAEAGKHPELRVMIRSSDFGGCSFVDNHMTVEGGRPTWLTSEKRPCSSGLKSEDGDRSPSGSHPSESVFISSPMSSWSTPMTRMPSTDSLRREGFSVNVVSTRRWRRCQGERMDWT
jgi:hypothetical protein